MPFAFSPASGSRSRHQYALLNSKAFATRTHLHRYQHMKTRTRHGLGVTLAMLLASSSMLAQDGAVLKVSLTDPLSGRYSMGLEKAITTGVSVAVELDYLSKEVFLESDHPWYVPITVRKEGFVFEPQLRFYRGEVLCGTYASLSGVFGLAEYKPTGTDFLDNSDWSSLGASVHIGHQLCLGSVVLDGYAGCTWAKDVYPGPYVESTVLFPPPSGLRFSGGLRFGLGRNKQQRSS